MKRKRFYNNKSRGEKWTEPEVGRPIEFADKYIEPKNESSDEYYHKSKKKKLFSSDEPRYIFRKIGIVIGCLVVVGIGYTIMDVCMEMNSMPARTETVQEDGGEVLTGVKAKAFKTDSVSLDGAVMLDTVIKDAEAGGYSAVAFDLKRTDGTIGYNSELATVVSTGAVSSPASDLEKSVAQLSKNGIATVGIISCYQDNVVTASVPALAVKEDGEVYKDTQGNAYLNPDSEEVYQYIKGIAVEASAMGINVLVLDKTELDSGISGSYNDGFDALAQRLQSDLGDKVTLLKPVPITVTASEEDEIQNQIDLQLQNSTSGNEIYSVVCTEKNVQTVKTILDEKGCSCYVLAE